MEAERLLAGQFTGVQLSDVPDAQLGEPLQQGRLPLRKDVRRGGVDQDQPVNRRSLRPAPRPGARVRFPDVPEEYLKLK